MDNNRLNVLARVLEESKKYVEMGQEIPINFQKIMFPSGRKECELVYGGKESYESILTKVIPAPLQEEKRFPTTSKKSDSEWTNKLIFGDNLQTLKSLIEMKKRDY